jgi:hypothetical protein
MMHIVGSAALFAKTSLPQWTDASPERLYVLFQGHQARSLNRDETDEYARLVMVVVANNFASNDWVKTLPQLRLDPQDVAQSTVMMLLRKSATPSMALRTPCVKTMLKMLNVAIYNFVMTHVLHGKRKQGRETPSTDYYGENSNGSEPHCADVAADRVNEPELFELLRAAEDDIIGDIPIRKPISVNAVERLYRHCIWRLKRDRVMTPYNDLPKWFFRRKVPIELHGLIVARINRFVRRYCS